MTNADVAARTPAAVRMVTPGYFPTLGLRIVEGRAIDDRDEPTAPKSVIQALKSLFQRNVLSAATMISMLLGSPGMVVASPST